jgi:muramoyltetrapeptide carboxypeptidase
VTNKLSLPAALRSGARVALVSPSGPITHPDDLQRASDNARANEWEPVLAEHAGASSGYLAGSDAERLSDLNAAIHDNSIDAIWCVRGGYGAMRLLDKVDYAALRRTPKPIIGFSDITALHCAIQRCCGLLTFHGPTARGVLSEFSRDSLRRAVIEHVDSCGIAGQAREIRAGRAAGRLVGGNLALIASLVGTPFAADLTDSILVLEDVNEPLYKVDRMLQQLLLAGAFAACKAIVFGDCSSGEENESSEGLDQLLASFAERLRIPCLAGMPFGHIPDQWTIPLGAQATLDTGERSLHVNLQ